jgi:hypothetical protein
MSFSIGTWKKWDELMSTVPATKDSMPFELFRSADSS